MIGLVDEFVLYDDAQYTRRDWRNRNIIRTPKGSVWLTIPVESKGKYEQAIREVRISDKGWAAKHWETLRHNYAKAASFSWTRQWLEPLYSQAADIDMLSAVNRLFIEAICSRLGIATKLRWSMEYAAGEGRSEKLLAICLQSGATRYLSGPAAKGYLDVPLFERHGVAVEWMEYGGYPEYPQVHPPFEHGVTILDLFMNVGGEARRYLKIPALRDERG